MTKLLLGLQNLLFGLIDWDKADNCRPESDYGDGKEAKTSLARHGWLDREIVNCWMLSPEEIERRFKNRQQVVTELKASALKEQEASNRLLVLTGDGGLWVDDKGRLMEPLVGGNMCFRRGTFYDMSMVQRTREMVLDDWAPNQFRNIAIPKIIPVNIKEYASDLERIADQLMENEKKTEGAKPLSYMALVAVAERFYAAAYNEKKFRTYFKDGTGQKLFATFEVDRRSPEFGLISRGRLKSDESGYINLQGLDKEKLRKLYTGKDDDAVIPVEEVAAAVGDKTKPPRAMPQKEMEDMSKRTKNPFVKELMYEISQGKNEGVSGLFARYDAALVELDRLYAGRKLKEGVAALKAISTEVEVLDVKVEETTVEKPAVEVTVETKVVESSAPVETAPETEAHKAPVQTEKVARNSGRKS